MSASFRVSCTSTTTLISTFCMALLLAQSGQAIDRQIYIGSVDRIWDYAPSGKNLVNADQSDASVFLDQGPQRIGHKYMKTLFREFTDDTYSTEKPHPQWLGLQGPVMRLEVDDTLYVHYKNMASGNYSIHPHGVLYDKANEGSVYQDGSTSGDSIAPGGTYTYKWTVPEDFAPTSADPACLSWTYHSHVHTAKDTYTGLMGMLLTCKKGSLNPDGTRKDVDKELTLLFKVIDENNSWLIEDNISNYTSASASINREDEDFKESNLMHSINGYLYGNLPGLEVCAGDKVSWHLFGMGSEVDMHTVYFHGQTLVNNNHRTDSLGLYPAEFVTADMVPSSPGRWLINCQTHDHYTAGMQAFLDVKDCQKGAGAHMAPVKVRKYYIAVEEVMWDYGPSGLNLFDGGLLNASNSDSATFFSKGPTRIGGIYKKALYYEYTNSSFTTRKPKDKNLGFLGPVIKAAVGDAIEVVFKNMASRPYTMQPQGVFYNKSSEGANYKDTTTGNNKGVMPNATYTYRWTVPDYVSPTDGDTDCITWTYTSAVNPVKDTYSGLVGPLVTCKRGTLDDNGQQKDVSKDFYLLFSQTDENLSWYIDDNIQALSSSVDKENEDFQASNKMNGINGLVYGNLPGLEMCQGDKIVWHVMSIGTETDLHTAHFHGQTFILTNSRRDTVAMVPGSFWTLVMHPDNIGRWALTCKTNTHYDDGMKALYTVNNCSKTSQSSQRYDGVVRTYYVAAEEMEWDFAPINIDPIDGNPLDKPGSASEIFVKKGKGMFIGHKYKKALYREYTNNNFNEKKPRYDNYLQMLGPIIKGEVGDTIKVVFKNKASRPYSIHPHGVLYSKKDEGAVYINGSIAVQPDQTHTYTWKVPERSGPTSTESACSTWSYYSHVNPTKDTDSGLVGPLIICRKGTLDSKNKVKEVDREFVIYFSVVDENKSWYLDENIRTYMKKTPSQVDKTNEDFEESNLMHSINGVMYGQNTDFSMMVGDRVNWYIMSLGTDIDMHTVHFHGQTFVQHKQEMHRKDTLDMFPGTFYTVEMKAVNVGSWLLHCHVNDHFHAGMMTMYDVHLKPTQKPTSGADAKKYMMFPLLSLGLSVAQIY